MDLKAWTISNYCNTRYFHYWETRKTFLRWWKWWMKNSRVMHSLFFAIFQLACKRIRWGVIKFTKYKNAKYNYVAVLHNARQETFSHLKPFYFRIAFWTDALLAAISMGFWRKPLSWSVNGLWNVRNFLSRIYILWYRVHS